MTAQTLPEKIWNRHLVHSAPGEPDLLYIDLHLVHEVTSPQAFDGLRLSGRTRAPPRAHRGDRGPQRPDGRHRPADRRPDLGQAGRHDAGQRRRVRHHAVPDGRSEPGHRPRHRSGAGPDAAGHDDRVRRQPHRDPRRVRRAGVRHRHERGRARAGHPDVAAVAAEVDGDRRRGRRAAGRHGQGHHPRDHRRDRHRRRHRSRHRVPRPGDRGAVDGRSHDGVQHVDRGGRPRRTHRARRHDVRLPRRPHPRPQGRGVGGRPRRLAVAALRRRRGVGQAGHDRRLGARRRTSRGAPTPARCCRSTPTSRPPTRSPIPPHASRSNGRSTYMDLQPGTPIRDDRCRHGVHRFVHEQPDRGPARRGRGLRGPHRHGEAGDGRARQPRREGAGRSRRASTASSSPPASTGASPGARCAWR